MDGWAAAHSGINARLIQSSVDDVERIACEVQEKYRRDQTVHLGGTEIEEAGYGDEVVEYMGLNDNEWALGYISETYMPNLHRRSGLMSIFTYVEGRLEKLCCLYQDELQLDSSYHDASGQGVQKYFQYLRKDVKLPRVENKDNSR